MKFNKKYIFFFIVTFCLVFCYSYFISAVYNDEIWNYGFAYNIASYLVPYRDFNLVTTPLYPMLASIFIKIFGHHLYSLHIFNSLILSFMICLIYYKIGKKSILLIPLALLNGYPGYNIFSVFLKILLLLLIDYKFKKKDIVIAFLVGLLFLTKQTVGVCLFIPMIYYSKDRIKSLIAFSIPILCLINYLILNDALYDFINYCFLGLFNFGSSNSIYLFLPVEIVICLVILFHLIKSKFTNEKLFYLLMFQVITIPIVDDYHFMIGMLPVLYYFLSIKEIKKFKLKYYFIIICFFCFLWNFYVHSYELGYLYNDKNSYLYGRNIPKYIEETITEISNYIDEVRDDYDYIYFFSRNAYYVKMNVLYPLTKYDLINNGNMGYNGSVKYIEEVDNLCKENSCMFILYKYEFRENNISQTNKDLVDYVKDNYTYFKEINDFDIYINN